MNKPDLSQVANAIEDMALRARTAADDLDRIAKRIRIGGEPDHAADAINIVTNLSNSVRMDKLVTRIVSAYQRANS